MTSSGGLEWAPLRVAYEQEKQRLQPAMDAAPTHPLLKPSSATGIRSAGTATALPAHEPAASTASAFVELDPLSLSALKDPLSAAVSSAPPAPPLPSTPSSSSSSSSNSASSASNNIRKQMLTDAERTTRSLWQVKKDQILAEYAVSGVLTISNSAAALFGPAVGGDEAGNKKVLDKYDQRMAALESRAAAKGGRGGGAGSTVKMTQQDYEVRGPPVRWMPPMPSARADYPFLSHVFAGQRAAPGAGPNTGT